MSGHRRWIWTAKCQHSSLAVDRVSILGELNFRCLFQQTPLMPGATGIIYRPSGPDGILLSAAGGYPLGKAWTARDMLILGPRYRKPSALRASWVRFTGRRS